MKELGRRGETKILEIFEKVMIRALEEKDHVSYIALERDRKVKLYVGGPNEKTDEVIQKNLKEYEPSNALLAIVNRQTDEYIGRCGYFTIGENSKAELHIVLKQEQWGKNVAREILPFLVKLANAEGLHSCAIIDENNVNSLGLMEKLGWKFVGTVKSKNYQNGHLRYMPGNNN